MVFFIHFLNLLNKLIGTANNGYCMAPWDQIVIFSYLKKIHGELVILKRIKT